MCIRSLHTLKVCNLFFGGIFSHTYLLKGVHIGTWADSATGSLTCVELTVTHVGVTALSCLKIDEATKLSSEQRLRL